MKVILEQDVKKLGAKGDVVNVSDGYARNYLIPKGLGVQASSGNLKEVKRLKEKEEKREQQALDKAEQLKKKLGELTVTIPTKAGENGKLFGSVTSKDIAATLQSKHGIKIDKRKLDLTESIKALGDYNVRVKIHPEVHGQLTVKVVAQ
ncbi:50S ribosomal protein L9 [Metallumcola ferriviriculae]|uniref:Large ribosomal subunit protein bL9 n=1 Tax=Metallumcola ferriviriculae TaxID=3039180 RepID=A0AAU0UK35_9FIRM|nr:50S ribosomal protein L9 [Desulfitibacteraceae bacterium MK1]